MNHATRALCALFLIVCMQTLLAASRPAAPAAMDEVDYITANAPATRADLIAKGDERWLAFVASAGEVVSFRIDGETPVAACAVDLLVVDDFGNRIRHDACAARHGRAMTLPHAGTYRARLKAADDRGVFHVTLHSAAREQPKTLACATGTLALDTLGSGAWDSSCASVSFSGHYAQYYVITVAAPQVITISLTSTTNAYLVLHDGPDMNGVTIASDDNRGPGLDALIVKTLAAGTYTIEATTASAAQVGNFTVAARTNTAPCYSTLKLNKAVDSKWLTSCESTAFDDHYARFYKLVVPSDEVVTITLSSATNAYLVLRSGETQLGPIVAQDDNRGAGLDAQIVRTLTAGTYTVEATTSSVSQLGNFTLVARTDVAPCFNKLTRDVTTSSSWSTQCESTTFDDHYARFYTLNVPASQVVTISLSSATNTYLILHSGPSPVGAEVARDDNAGPGLDARIVATLDAGVYTVEATTSSASQLGDFDLTARTNTAPCFDTLALNTPAADVWQVECSSVAFNDHYAKYYTLTISSTQLVTLSLSSATNAYMLLRSGPTQLAPVLLQNDNNGPGLDARIAAYLQPGTYTVEATTASASQLGNFTLNARSTTTPCNTPVKLNKVTQDAWNTSCAAVTLEDHYAKFYTLTLPSAQIVTATLSSATNAYLVLHAGPDQYGPQIATNDNSGAGLDARIVGWLAAGTYTYEATTSSASQVGSFSFVARNNSPPCFDTIGLSETVSGAWATSCTSTTFDDHYSKYYTLTVPADRSVSILLRSPTNAYLVLRGGPDAQLGTIVAQDDNSGGGFDAKIVRTLTAGTYTIEATTASSSQLGSFTLTTSR
jgi:type IV secretory pathway TrbF-like protein